MLPSFRKNLHNFSILASLPWLPLTFKSIFKLCFLYPRHWLACSLPTPLTFSLSVRSLRVAWGLLTSCYRVSLESCWRQRQGVARHQQPELKWVENDLIVLLLKSYRHIFKIGLELVLLLLSYLRRFSSENIFSKCLLFFVRPSYLSVFVFLLCKALFDCFFFGKSKE